MAVVTPDNFSKGAYVDEDEDESGVTLSAGLGHVRAERGNIGAEVKGPNYGTRVVSSAEGDEFFAKAELASGSITAGKVKAEGKLPSASAAAMYSEKGAEIFARAELASVSASAGPLKAKLGLSADTGVGVRDGSVEAKVLGTGFTLGRKIGFSVGGSGLEFNLW